MKYLAPGSLQRRVRRDLPLQGCWLAKQKWRPVVPLVAIPSRGCINSVIHPREGIAIQARNQRSIHFLGSANVSNNGLKSRRTTNRHPKKRKALQLQSGQFLIMLVESKCCNKIFSISTPPRQCIAPNAPITIQFPSITAPREFVTREAKAALSRAGTRRVPTTQKRPARKSVPVPGGAGGRPKAMRV